MKPAPRNGQRILLVDDDPDHLALCQRWLEIADYQVSTAASGPEALAHLERDRPDLVISDLVMDGMNGLRLLAEIHRIDLLIPTLIISGDAGIPEAMQAAHLGVNGFLEKPLQKDVLLEAVSAALATGSRPIEPPTGDADQAGGLIFSSTLMQELLRKCRLVAAGDSTVLITGETGTGKEMVARTIHGLSARRDRPFVSINCSALPEQLLESELFGHEKGAFTGAASRHTGLFQAADGGTLFLDEIGDMPLVLQAKLLHTLQDFHVRPLGSVKNIKVDVRVLSATHQDLVGQVADKTFREDLYYRLNVVPLKVPPLRERMDDVPMLVAHFLTLLAAKAATKRKHFAPEAMRLLLQSSFPGNVRQLSNIVERCVVLSSGPIIPATLVAEALEDQQIGLPTLDEAKHAFERRYVTHLLRLSGGNVTFSAHLAGRNRSEFYKLLARHKLRPEDFRSPDESDAG